MKENIAVAQSPGHITGFFRIYRNGSTGAGINIKNGMRTTVEFSQKDSFHMNGKRQKLIVSEKVVALYRKKTRKKFFVKVQHQTPFPIGFGLGISGAGALSLSLCLNKLLGTEFSKKTITEIATRAEIECGTGLGDVRAENYAGFLMGKKPYPSKSALRIKCREKFIVLGFFRAIETKKIIHSAYWKRKINRSGEKGMKALSKNKSMRAFIRESRAFSLESGLATQRIRKIMRAIPEASMAMLGETAFIPTNNPEMALSRLKKYCKKTMVAGIALNGAGIL
ncbi:MAG: hypothetical protein AABW99_02815 [archaeon]